MGAKFAHTVWQWGTTKEDFIQGAKDIKYAGFEYFESVKGFIDIFADDIPGFKAICKEIGVIPVGAYFHLNGTKENDIDDIEKKLPFMVENNMFRMSVQAPGVFGRAANDEELKYNVEAITKIGKICKPYGVKPCVHPHYNTTIMVERDIDFVMQNTDPSEVFFGPDTAHLTAGDCNPVEIFDRYKERIQFTHLKDIRDAMESEGMEEGKEVYSNFRELGEGNVDFPGVFKVLKSVNYDGYLCAELDRSRFNNKISAEINMLYLQKTW